MAPVASLFWERQRAGGWETIPVSNTAEEETVNKNLKLSIGGMDCEGCATSIENLLRMRDLVKDAKVDYEEKAATIDFDETKTDKQKIIEAITEAGYEATEVE